MKSIFSPNTKIKIIDTLNPCLHEKEGYIRGIVSTSNSNIFYIIELVEPLISGWSCVSIINTSLVLI